MDNHEFKAKIIRELIRYHESINDLYNVSEPHNKVVSDMFMYSEELYKDVINVIKWGDQDENMGQA